MTELPPIRDMRDRSPKSPDSRSALVVFLIRAYMFWNHPYFQGDCTVPREVVLDSLAFRARPLLMTESDDASLGGTIGRYEECGGDAQAATVFRRRYRQWYELSHADLNLQPPGVHRLTEFERWQVTTPPRSILWDFVYGHGVHSDNQRVFRGAAAVWSNPAGEEGIKDFWETTVLRMLSAARPLIVDVHNAVLALTSVRSSSGPAPAGS